MKDKLMKLVTNTKTKTAMLSATVAAALPQIANAGAGKSDPESIVATVLDTVVKIFPLVGGFFVVAGLFKLVMAYRNDQPEAQTAAAKDIVIGVVFLVFGLFIWDPIKNAIL